MPVRCEPGRLSFLGLGDSYTVGEGVSALDRWPTQLSQLLCNHGIMVGEPEIIAKTGWTTTDLFDAMERHKPSGTYDLVSLQIGVNDQYRGYGESEYGRQFSNVLSCAIRLAGDSSGRVIVLSIPDWGVTPFAAGQDRARIAQMIDRFNVINRHATHRAGARYVDITPISRQAGSDESLLAHDRLHPSGVIYRRWAELMLPAARAAIQSP